MQSPASTRGELIAEGGRALLLQSVLSCGPRRPCEDCSPTHSGMRKEADLERLDVGWDFCLFAQAVVSEFTWNGDAWFL